MKHSDAISTIESLLPRMKEKGTPEQILLKHASDNNLSPAQLEKLAHVFNTAKSLTFFEKAANRGDSFAVIDTEDLVKSYTDYQPREVMGKAASNETTVATKFPGARELLRKANPSFDKAAAEGGQENKNNDKEEAYDEVETAAGEGHSFGYKKKKRIGFPQETEGGANKKVAAQLLDAKIQKELDIEEEVKEAKALVRNEGLSKSDLCDDILFSFGKEAGTRLSVQLFGDVYASEDYEEKRAFDKEMYTSPERLTFLDKCASIYEELLKWDELRVKHQAAEKAAAIEIPSKKEEAKWNQTQQNKQDAQTKRDEAARKKQEEADAKAQKDQKDRERRDAEARDLRQFELNLKRQLAGPDKDRYGDAEGAVLSGAGKAVGGVGGILGKGIESMNEYADSKGPVGELNQKRLETMDKKLQSLGIKKDEADQRQKKVDNAVDIEERNILLMRLMQSDPIISEADPETVSEMFNTLVSVDPEMVKDKAQLRMALREGLQYGTLVTPTLSSIAELRERINKGQRAKGESND